ncbi:MAG: hypothetical protein QOK40_2041 [Miltoncostaeaceae bacterium]|nr:hypothetical protein [Miltoncostaeaceae bacterium]
MRAPRSGTDAACVRRQRGFTLIELMVAVVLLLIGVLAIATSIGGSRKLISTSERQQVMIHRGQLEIERIQAMSYSQVALLGTPVHSTAPLSPYFAVSAGPSPTLALDRTGAASEQLVIDPTGGALPPAATTWSDGRLSGTVADFVTWSADAGCGSGCPAASDFKRVTVAVTVNGTGGPKTPIMLSTYVTDPNAAPAGYIKNGVSNPLASPSTTCQDALGATVDCTGGIGQGTAVSWFLYDTPAPLGAYQAISASHSTHPTIAGLTGLLCTLLTTAGCPKPDLMGTSPTPDQTPPPPLYGYSTDQPGAYPGGRVLRRDSGTLCGGLLSGIDNTKGEMWVTPPLPTGSTLTGEGGITLFSQTLSGFTGPVTLCLRLYAVAGSIANLISLPPTPIGLTIAYPFNAWPAALSAISFTFRFASTGVALAPGLRVGVRLWIDQSSSSDIVIVYDHPSYKSLVQLNSQ